MNQSGSRGVWAKQNTSTSAFISNAFRVKCMYLNTFTVWLLITTHLDSVMNLVHLSCGHPRKVWASVLPPPKKSGEGFVIHIVCHDPNYIYLQSGPLILLNNIASSNAKYHLRATFVRIRINVANSSAKLKCQIVTSVMWEDIVVERSQNKDRNSSQFSHSSSGCCCEKLASRNAALHAADPFFTLLKGHTCGRRRLPAAPQATMKYLPHASRLQKNKSLKGKEVIMAKAGKTRREAIPSHRPKTSMGG